MKIEHLTALGSSMVRDTIGINAETIKHFAIFETGASVTAKIPQTPFECKVTMQHGIALFNLSVENILVSVSVCCFEAADTEVAMLYVRSLLGGLPTYKNAIIRQPENEQWLFSIVVDFVGGLPYAMLAGEIELYIYHAIGRGLNYEK